VGDAGERPLDRLGVEEELLGGDARAQGATAVVGAAFTCNSFPASLDRVKGVDVSRGTLARRADGIVRRQEAALERALWPFVELTFDDAPELVGLGTTLTGEPL
jgi:hypothetical protein